MILTAFLLFLRRDLLSKLTAILTVVCLLPTVICVIARIYDAAPRPMMEETMSVLYLSALAALVPVFHAVSAFHEQFESRTIVYLLTRPPTRASYVIAKFLSAWVCSSFSLMIGVAAVGLVCGWGTPNTGFFALLTFRLMSCCVLAAGVYCALFLVFGLALKNPVLIGLVFTFGWENLIAYLPGSAPYYSVGLYPRALFIHWADVDPTAFNYQVEATTPSVLSGPPDLTSMAKIGSVFELPSTSWSLGVMVGLSVLMIGAAVLLFQRREDA
ncbi:MAG: ABC transporter permease [Planctomycetes bacterium]|nr:ABC transporter permease [Planctomycetota bacterium]